MAARRRRCVWGWGPSCSPTGPCLQSTPPPSVVPGPGHFYNLKFQIYRIFYHFSNKLYNMLNRIYMKECKEWLTWHLASYSTCCKYCCVQDVCQVTFSLTETDERQIYTRYTRKQCTTLNSNTCTCSTQ